MQRRQFTLGLAASLAAGASPARAAEFPSRPISIVTGYSPGGSTDIAARLLADRMAQHLGPEARVLVENRPGAAGTIATEWLKRQPADGHTIMVQETGAGVAAPAALIGGTRYDTVADFTQIGMISVPPSVIVVTERFPGRTAQEVLAHMRGAPAESLTYASSGIGGVLHLRSEMLAQSLGTRFVHVPYRSGAQMLQAILTGEAQFGVAALASATPLLREGRVRGVAMMGGRRFPLYPDIPTLTELGIPGFDDGGWFMMIGPAGIPEPTLRALNRALVLSLADPTVRERMLNAGHDPAQEPNTPERTRAFLTSEAAKYREIVARTGVRLQP